MMDVIGALTYSDRPDVVLEKYHALLKVGGSVHFTAPEKHYYLNASTGEVINVFKEFVKKYIEGYEVVNAPQPNFAWKNYIELRKISSEFGKKFDSIDLVDVNTKDMPPRYYFRIW
ncbi:MAG: hypothetical protein R3A45_01295 [Bdellovibrionota bacterium]